MRTPPTPFLPRQADAPSPRADEEGERDARLATARREETLRLCACMARGTRARVPTLAWQDASKRCGPQKVVEGRDVRETLATRSLEARWGSVARPSTCDAMQLQRRCKVQVLREKESNTEAWPNGKGQWRSEAPRYLQDRIQSRWNERQQIKFDPQARESGMEIVARKGFAYGPSLLSLPCT